MAELLVSSYDPVVSKTIWQCAQCHFSSKARYTVKQHIETHISGFIHQCPQCEKTCKTRNALRAHIMRAHTVKPQQQQQQQQNNQQQNYNYNNHPSPQMSPGPDNMMQIQFQEMGEPVMKPPRRPRQRRPHDEELERQIRLLLVSNYDPVEVKTTWSCAQCNYSNKLQFTVKQHIETHITSIVHQCVQCPKILKTRNALRAHMIQKHEPKRIQSPPWMGNTNNYSTSPSTSPNNMQQQPRQIVHQQSGNQMVQHQPRQRRKQAEVRSAQTPMDVELDRQVAELMVSNYDAVLAKTTWQCAQCHFSSKIRSTVKEHIETHISGFTHQCTMCEKTCKTRNALRVHTVRAHTKPAQMQQQQGSSSMNSQGGSSNNMNNSQSPPKICYEPQPSQQQQQSSNIHPIAKKSIQQVVVQPDQQIDQKPIPIMHYPAPQKQMPKQVEQPRQGIMNPPMFNRPMYGHPMMMGHPMI